MALPTRTTRIFRALGVASLLFVAWIATQVIPPRGAVRGHNAFRAPSNGRPLIIAHAGGKGLNPENTLEAFAASVALGCDMIELDVRLTKDGVLVTHHDATIDRTSNASGRVADLTLAELQALNFGYSFQDASGAYPYRGSLAHIATVQQLFQLYPQLPMAIELKDRAEVGRRAAAELADVIAKHATPEKVIVSSFDDDTLDVFRNAAPKVPTASAKRQTRNFVLLSMLGLHRLWEGGVDAAQVPSDAQETTIPVTDSVLVSFNLARPDFIRTAHARNMAVHYWTVNDAGEMRRLIELGADGLITDFPDRLKAVLAKPNPQVSRSD